MKYCDDDVKRAREIIKDIKDGRDMIELCSECVRFTDEEKHLVYNALDITKNIVRYANKLDDDKLNKVLKMKMIIEEGCK